MGPTLIFDKSALQSLSIDEAVWLDNFFITNITPLFFIETLADLEKQVRAGLTPEQAVGALAHKTPDAASCANVHHASLMAGELLGVQPVDMRYGRPVVSVRQEVQLGDQLGCIIKRSPEEEALRRWQAGQFLEVERTVAKQWRRALSVASLDAHYQWFQRQFLTHAKPKNVSDAKAMADAFIDSPNQADVFQFGLRLLGASPDIQGRALSRWNAAGRPQIAAFAPYFRYVFGVELFFFLAIAADLISRERPSNKIDIAYLYYLPFCMVFSSNDRLHARVVPLFLGATQTFIDGHALKSDLMRLDRYYSGLPDELKQRGIISFASEPPPDVTFVVTQLWDKYLPSWRHKCPPKRGHEKEVSDLEALELIRQFKEESTPVDADRAMTGELDMMLIERRVLITKGKWKRFPPEVQPDEQLHD
ncbi:MAG TPA: hypothetical protein VGM03_18975 [Phycisphaerae bacterium]|jgi:hypothetical protein